MKELQICATGVVPVPDKTFEALKEAYNLSVDLRMNLCKASYHLRDDPDCVRDLITKLEKTMRTVSMILEDTLGLEGPE